MVTNKISGAEAIIRCLLEEGVDIVYGYPGGAIMPVYDELYKFQRCRRCTCEGRHKSKDGVQKLRERRLRPLLSSLHGQILANPQRNPEI